jgi:putative transposase
MNSVNSEIKRFAHSIGQNWYHIVLVCKARYPVFKRKEVKEIAEKAFDFVCTKHGIDIFTKEVMPEHVHLFVACPPNYSVRKLSRILKGASSFYIRSEWPSLRKYPHLWNRGIMYRSIGSVSAETIRRYIEKSNDWSKTKQKKLA